MADYTGRDQRLKYLFANGGGGGGSCKVISGYYHDGDFYEDQSYTHIITGDTECLYIDLDTTTLYLFDGTDYVEVQGGGGGTGGGGFSSDTLFSGEYYDINTSQLLSANYTDYDYLLVEGCAKASYYHSKNTILIQVSDIDGASTIGGEFAIGMINPLNSSFFWWMRFSFPDGTHIKISDKNLGGWTGDSPMITKVLGLKSISKHTYSTTEQVVGTWIDGQTIYECTFDFSASPVAMTYNSWASTGITITGCSKIINAIGMSDVAANCPIIATYGSELRVMTQRDSKGQKLAYITVQYTKSTT